MNKISVLSEESAISVVQDIISDYFMEEDTSVGIYSIGTLSQSLVDSYNEDSDDDKIVQWGKDWVIFNVDGTYVKIRIESDEEDACWVVDSVVAEPIKSNIVELNRRNWTTMDILEKCISILITQGKMIHVCNIDEMDFQSLKLQFGESILLMPGGN